MGSFKKLPSHVLITMELMKDIIESTDLQLHMSTINQLLVSVCNLMGIFQDGLFTDGQFLNVFYSGVRLKSHAST